MIYRLQIDRNSFAGSDYCSDSVKFPPLNFASNYEKHINFYTSFVSRAHKNATGIQQYTIRLNNRNAFIIVND